MGWRARQRSRQRDGAVKKGETVRPRKDRAAAPAYQLLHKTSVLISINSNDKCGPLWQRLINSRRGETHQSKNSNHSMPQAWTSVKRERAALHCLLELIHLPCMSWKGYSFHFSVWNVFVACMYMFSVSRLQAWYLRFTLYRYNAVFV